MTSEKVAKPYSIKIDAFDKSVNLLLIFFIKIINLKESLDQRCFLLNYLV